MISNRHHNRAPMDPSNNSSVLNNLITEEMNDKSVFYTCINKNRKNIELWILVTFWASLSLQIT